MSKKTKAKIADYLPEEIRVQILYKLPIKSLVRFTCVSKTWLSLIQSTTFISTHRNLSSNKNPLLLYRNRHNCNQFSLFFDKEENNHHMDFYFPLTHDRKYCLSVVGTINGLICLNNHNYYHNINISNPFIKKSVTLPTPSGACYNHLSLGFGFDSRSNDYKVLRVAQTVSVPNGEGDEDEVKDREYDKDTLEAEIYSLSTNSWKRICAPRYEIEDCLPQAFVNGVMHVLAFRGPIDDNYHNLILGFNVADEVFKEIALPPSLADTLPSYLNTLVYKESIAVFDNDDSFIGSSETVVWVMEEYGVVESWTRMIFSFNGHEEQVLPPRVSGFRKNGELFLDLHGGDIVSCELGSLEKRIIVRGRYSFVDYFVESMDLLDNANALSDPTVEDDAIGDAMTQVIKVIKYGASIKE